MPADSRVPGYLGRIVTAKGVPVGTCFQIAPCLIVTAWHVLNDLDCGTEGAIVSLEALNSAGTETSARVLRVDELHDLAVLWSDVPLPGSIGRWLASDRVDLTADVVVTGVCQVDDPDREYGYLDAPGRWAGGTTRDKRLPLGRFSSSDVLPGMSGAPVRLVADDRVVGVVSARYNSADGWLTHAVWVVRTEDLRRLVSEVSDTDGTDAVPPPGAIDWASMTELMQLPEASPVSAARRTSRRVGRGTAIAASALVAVLTAVLTVTMISRTPDESEGPSTRASANASPVPADPSSPPVLVENVTGVRSNSGDGSFVLPEPLAMTAVQLADFNTNVVPNSKDFSSWYGTRGGAAVGFGIVTVTLRGNAKEPVRIVDLKVDKECGAPLNGTFFQGYGQSTGDNIKLGFDLDSPDPSAQGLVFTARGLVPTGDHFFSLKTVTLGPGEVETFTFGAFTKKYSCSFTLKLIVATGAGSFSQDVDYHGKPFVVTARAAPSAVDRPLSGYRAAYALEESREWIQVDPSAQRN